MKTLMLFFILFNLVIAPTNLFKKIQNTEKNTNGLTENESIQNSSAEDQKNVLQNVAINEDKTKDTSVTVALNSLGGNKNFSPAPNNFASNLDKYMGFGKRVVKEEPKPPVNKQKEVISTPPLVNQKTASSKDIKEARNPFETDGSVGQEKSLQHDQKKNQGSAVKYNKQFKNPYEVDGGEEKPKTPKKEQTNLGVAKKKNQFGGPSAFKRPSSSTKNKTGQNASENPEEVVQEEPAPPPPPEIRPIKIIFEKSFLMDSIKKTGRVYTQKQTTEYHNQIIELVEKTDAFLRNYITITGEPSDITIPAGFDECSPLEPAPYELDKTKFKVEKSFVADVVIFVFAMDEPDQTVIASAMPCQTFTDGTAMIGRIKFNISKLIKSVDMNNMFQKSLVYQTIVHEIFHVLAFHGYIIKDFYTKKLNDYPHLKKFKDSKAKNPILEYAHWSDQYLYNDLMIPDKSSGTLLSIFSLEYVEMANNGVYRVKKENLQFNPVLDKIHNWFAFLTYKCKDKVPSDYENFCSKAEADAKDWTCDSTRMYVMYCESDISPTNNCAKRVFHSDFQCVDDKLVRDDDGFSVFGADSRCFGSVKKNIKGTFCLGHKIEDNQLYIVGRYSKHLCTKKNEVVDVLLKDKNDGEWYAHEILCPDPTEFMEMERKIACPDYCNFNGVCNAGVCYCFDGFDPKDNCLSPKKTKYFTTFSQSYRP